MAEKADGYIVIDTKISTDGVKAGTAEIEAACRKAASSVSSIGDKASEAANKTFGAFAGGQVKTEAFAQVEREIDKTMDKIAALDAKKEKFLSLGGSQNSKQWASMEYDTNRLLDQYDRLIAKRDEMMANGEAYVDPSAAQQGSESLEQVAASADDAAGATQNAGASFDDLNKVFKKGVRNILKYAFSIRSTYILVRKIKGAVKEGLNNLVQIDPDTNAAISTLTSSLGMLKNSLAAAFAPIIQIVAPYLQIFIKKVVDAINWVGMFFAVLSGKKTYTKAIAYQDDYAASLGKTAKEAKKAARNLSGLDEITNWQSDTDSVSDSAAATAEQMFETVEISSDFIEKVEKVKKEFEKLLPVIKLIGAALLAWKITEFLSSLGTAITKLTGMKKAVSELAGVAMIGLSITMVVDDVKSIISGDLEFGSAESIVRTIIEGSFAGLGFSLVFGTTPLVTIPLAMTIAAAIKWSFTEDGESFWDKVRNFFDPTEPLYGAEDVDLLDYPTLEEEGGNVVALILDTITVDAENKNRAFEAVGKNMSGGISDGFTDTSVWGKIKQAITHFPEWIRGEYQIHSPSKVFAKIGEYCALGFTNPFNGIADKVAEIFGKVKDKIKTPINGIIGFINQLISAFFSGINYMIDKVNTLSFDVPDWVPGLGGKKFGFNLSHVTAPQIPLLAKGAVIPPNAPFLATLGDQRNGTNLEAPENLIRQIIREESGNGNYTFIAELDGEVIFKKVIQKAQAKKRANGKNPLLV